VGGLVGAADVRQLIVGKGRTSILLFYLFLSIFLYKMIVIISEAPTPPTNYSPVSGTPSRPFLIVNTLQSFFRRGLLRSLSLLMIMAMMGDCSYPARCQGNRATTPTEREQVYRKNGFIRIPKATKKWKASVLKGCFAPLI
jgi:hypothetical protein